MKILKSLDFKLYNMTLQVSECCYYGVLFRIFYTLPEIFQKYGEHSIMPLLDHVVSSEEDCCIQVAGGFFVTF